MENGEGRSWRSWENPAKSYGRCGFELSPDRWEVVPQLGVMGECFTLKGQLSPSSGSKENVDPGGSQKVVSLVHTGNPALLDTKEEVSGLWMPIPEDGSFFCLG